MFSTTGVIVFLISATAAVLAVPARVHLTRSSEGYQAQIHVENQDSVQLNLKKSATPVFHPDFKIFSVGKDSEFHTDLTPSRQILDEIENSIYEDVRQGAVVRLVNDGAGVHGFVGNMRIYHDDGNHDISQIHDSLDQRGKSDFLEIPEEYRQPKNLSVQSSGIGIQAVANVELFLVIDYATYLLFGAGTRRIIEYEALFIKGVGNIFATNNDPIVTFQVVGIRFMTAPAQQPFIENNKLSGVISNLENVLRQFNGYLASNTAILPNYDVAALMTAETVMRGQPIGYAFTEGSCNVNVRGAVSQDQSASFIGVRLLAHELGHTLGSTHDGTGEDENGCTQDDHFIMHPEIGPTGGENRFLFSQCSRNLMITFIDSATCLRTTNFVGTPWTVPSNTPGDLVDLNAVCRALFNRPNAVVDPTFTPDQICEGVRCQYDEACNINNCPIRPVQFNPPSAPDGAPCGSNNGPPTGPFTCTAEGTFRHTNCRMYYWCVRISGNLYTYVFTCPTGSYFNPATLKCVLGGC
ncbi:Snake venom metalloproteinase acutolysin-C [Folsomia candida]|uniref:Snake venom metalloproteinase acutolysin-C n=1 Tax=Folsomia candida TaxID=158441 RepID=A0A226DVA1_FOLCA|nr:Snake venom metalloproteinase acutolysin-C [Folsomia candida]